MPAERPIPGRQPDRFAQIIKDSLSGTEIFEKLGKELDGFRGKMAAEITAWHTEGLGRVIGYPLLAGNVYERRAVNESDYRGVMYALPLTDESVRDYNKRVLLVVPGEETCDYRIVSPRKPRTIEEQVKEWGSEESVIKVFDSYFSPSKEPNVHPALRPLPGQNPAEIFFTNEEVFNFFEITDKHLVSNEKKQQTTLNKALIVARRLQRLPSVRALVVDDDAIKETLGNDIFNAVDIIEDNFFGQWEQQFNSGEPGASSDL